MSSGEGSGQQNNNNSSSGSGDMTGGQQQQSQQAQQGQNVNQQQQQQLQLQQAASTQNNQGAQNQMQQLQVIQQPLQNQFSVQQLYNPSQGQILMPGINFNPQLNPQIQVIGKPFQQNQLGSQHITGYTTIPTSAANMNNNNQAYILNLMTSSSQPSILQQHQQSGKPGEMQKIIQPQITQQLQQGLTWAPQFLQNLQNPIFIRGPNDNQMYIQQQQPMHSNAGSHQQFTMPLTATGQLPTSITSIASGTANGLQQVTQQQQNQGQGNQGNQAQVQQNQSQNPQPIQPANVLSMKSPANLQPKPPLQIQPSPTNQQTHLHQQQQLQQQQVQNVTMSGPQYQMIPQPTSQSNVINQQILAQNPQTITTQVMHSAQGQQLQQQRQLTILPQQGSGQGLQHQQVTFIQQQQHQAIRPNYTVTAAPNNNPQPQGITATPVPQQRPKIRKPGVGRGTSNNAAASNQQNKVMYPRPNMNNSVAPGQIQPKIAQTSQSPSGATITRVSVANSMSAQQQQSIQQQPLKTINMSALHTPPSLPDATLTPLIPQSNSQMTATPVQQQPPQPLQMFATTTTTQLPTPNISITPAPPPKKDDGSVEPAPESRMEPEKENTKLNNNSQSSEDVDSNKSNLPKAMVKPQAVLTHIIEGFVIQEASEPFPMSKNGEGDEPPKKKMAMNGEMGKCENCGKVDLKTKFKKKRFCSSHCAKETKVRQHQISQQAVNNAINSVDNHINSKAKPKSKKWGECGDAESTDETSSSMGDTSVVSPATTENTEEEPKINPVKWNVAEVVDFVRSLPGCSENADDFAVQEIDGQALMLLKEDHLMSAIGMKLGPALKLCAKIEALRAACSGGAGQNSGNA